MNLNYATAVNEPPQDEVEQLLEPPLVELAMLPAVSPPYLYVLRAMLPAVSPPLDGENNTLEPPIVPALINETYLPIFAPNIFSRSLHLYKNI